MRLRVKICCMASIEEAAMAAVAGADMVGMVGPMPSGAGVIDLRRARRIAEGAAPWVTPVLLTSGETGEAIAAEVDACPVRCVQIVRHVAPEVHRELGRRLPGMRRIQAIHVEGPEALELIERYAGLADAFLLDSGRPGSQELGGTGRVHDWQVSAEFVRRSPLPVFLAGGLGPENVAEAIATVRPFGVDLCSGVRTENRLDQGKLSAFMAAVTSVTSGTAGTAGTAAGTR
jgi:phosphoribosylanthranilate isomerase